MEPQQRRAAPWRSVLPVVGVGVVWSTLSLLLHLGGHEPSGPVFVAPRNIYYAAQAGFAVPVLLAQFWILFAVTHIIARKPDAAAPVDYRGALALAFALPLGLTWLLPDICAYAWAGFEGMAKVVRVAAPVTAVITFALVFRSVRRAYRQTWGRTAVAALLGCIAQALIGGAVLR